MKGRLETKLKTEATIRKQLEGTPDFLKNYIYNISSSREPRTVLEYLRRIKLFLAFLQGEYGKVDISKVTDSDISRYIMSIETKRTKIKNKETGEIEEKISATSASYLKQTHTALMGFFSYLELKGYIQQNPVKLVKRVQREDSVERRRLTEKDLRKVMKSVKKFNEDDTFLGVRDEAIVMVLINTGMRETALTEINVEDIDFEKKELRIIDKRHTEHKYYVNPKLEEVLQNYIKKREEYLGKIKLDALFVSQKKARIHPNTVANLVKKYTFDALGVKLAPHKLRAAFCTILYDKTRDIEFVRDAVGHKNDSTTRKYIVKDGSEKKKASNIMANILK